MPALSPAAPVADARLGQYRAPLQRVAIAKMLHQLSQVGAANIAICRMKTKLLRTVFIASMNGCSISEAAWTNQSNRHGPIQY